MKEGEVLAFRIVNKNGLCCRYITLWKLEFWESYFRGLLAGLSWNTKQEGEMCFFFFLINFGLFFFSVLFCFYASGPKIRLSHVNGRHTRLPSISWRAFHPFGSNTESEIIENNWVRFSELKEKEWNICFWVQEHNKKSTIWDVKSKCVKEFLTSYGS